ncbi:MAG: S-methyl-5-thioribose-1-phosphate isomerase [Chloroflexi bacterium]|nr:S-methyl-5-thioribose-1-phosphate isomerase [Chloroflexota bacterium]
MRTVEWNAGKVKMIDQRQLPWEFVHVDFETHEDVATAIKEMVVRGAPAIGAAASFGMVLAANQNTTSDLKALQQYLGEAGERLKAARPTAVNLMWAVDRILRLATSSDLVTAEELREALLQEAQNIADDDVVINRRMAANGATLIKDGDTILHHCNTGMLATVDYGTALGVIRMAHEQGKNIHVLLDETRPRMQGARLSAWECKQLGIPFEIIPDSAAGHFMAHGEVDIVLVGADRVASNGDTANKIGTYHLGVLAKENGVPFYPVVPTSTIDMNIQSGADIPIEERGPDELRTPYGKALVPEDYPVRNPAFDVTPARYITGLVTENGIVRAPFIENIARVVQERPLNLT